MKKILPTLAFALLFLVLGLELYFVSLSEPIEPVMRPPNLPSDAFWQGGEDGGWWYSCKNKKQDFEYYCIVYSEDGKITWEDDFELYISLYEIDKKIPMKDFQKQTYLTADNVSAFNGASDIYMQGSLFLKSKNYTWDNPIPHKVDE